MKEKEKEFESSLNSMTYLSELFNGKASNPQETVAAPTPAPAVKESEPRPREKKTRRAYLLMKPSIYNTVMKKAKREGSSLNQIVEDALVQFLGLEK